MVHDYCANATVGWAVKVKSAPFVLAGAPVLSRLRIVRYCFRGATTDDREDLPANGREIPLRRWGGARQTADESRNTITYYHCCHYHDSSVRCLGEQRHDRWKEYIYFVLFIRQLLVYFCYLSSDSFNFVILISTLNPLGHTFYYAERTCRLNLISRFRDYRRLPCKIIRKISPKSLHAHPCFYLVEYSHK